jgi:hypothetical protein
MSPPSTRVIARAFSPAPRIAAAALLALAALCVLDLAAGLIADMIAPGPFERVPLPLMVRRLLFFALMPSAAYVMLRWLVRAQIDVGPDMVVVDGRRARLEIPRAAIAGVQPWRLPWPGAGVAIRLRSGRAVHLAAPDPTPLVAALGGETAHPALVAARARRATRWLRHPLHALVLAPLVPTAILFRLHQIITFGGWLGEYRWYGLARWLDTLLGVWLWVAGHMLCWYAIWRVIVAILAWPAARFLAEPRARAARWLLEAIAAAGYYGGVAWLLLSRLAQ